MDKSFIMGWSKATRIMPIAGALMLNWAWTIGPGSLYDMASIHDYSWRQIYSDRQ